MKINDTRAHRMRPASLEDDLRVLAHPDARDQQFAQYLDHVLEQHYSQGITLERDQIMNPTLPAMPGRTRPRFNPRLVILAALFVLAVGIAGFLAAQNPTPVSAHEILQRAAAGRMAPNQIVHRQYELTQTMRLPQRATADIWIESDSQGTTMRSAWTVRSDEDSPDSIQHILVNGATAQRYDYNGRDKTTTMRSGPVERVFDGLNLFDGPSLARFFDRVTQGGVQRTHVLPPQTLDGVPVVGIRFVDEADIELATIYFDTQYYVLRHAWMPDRHIWITLDEVVAPAAVPTDVFTWNPPPGAREVPLPPTDSTSDK